MTTRRPTSRKAEGDAPEAVDLGTCSHDDGALVLYEGDNPHKAGRRTCATCGCSYHWNGAHVAIGAACAQRGELPPVTAIAAPVTETPTEGGDDAPAEGADGEGKDAGEVTTASS